MERAFEIIFPLIFGLFAVYYGFISFSVLIRKKPVVVSSRLILVLIAVAFIPLIIIEVVQYLTTPVQLCGAGVVTLIVPVMFTVLFVFYAFMLKGISIYGITSDDFSKYFEQTLTALNMKFTEKMNKVHLDDLNTDISVSFAEWTGTGIIKPKDKKVDMKAVAKELRSQFRENDLRPKKVIAVFYLIFAVIMIAAAVGFGILFVQIAGE